MKTHPFFLSGLIGLAVIAVSVVSLLLFPQSSPGQIDGINSPIIAFEFAQTVEEIEALFGPAGSAERAALALAMDRGNRLDFLYMLLYSAFMFTFAVQAGRLSGKAWLYAGAVLAVAALLGDVLENVQLLAITAKLDSGAFSVELARLYWFTWLKWGSLAVYFVWMGAWLWGNGRFPTLIALASFLTFLLGLLAFIRRGPITEAFTLAIALMFLLLIIYSFWRKADAHG
jgi:hypothetical protein